MAAVLDSKAGSVEVVCEPGVSAEWVLAPHRLGSRCYTRHLESPISGADFARKTVLR
jgi:hypothetical protein